MTWLCAARSVLVLLFAASAGLLVAVHWSERGPSGSRRLERVCLLAVSLPLLGWLAFVYTARSSEFADFGRRVARGEIADLRAAKDGARLMGPLAPYLPDEAERRNTADAIAARVRQSGGSLRNVGALGSRGGLGAALLRQIKPALAVRDPAVFRAQFLIWCGIFFAAFWGVHVFWLLRGFAGDELMLPALELLSGVGFILMVGLRDSLRDQTLFVGFGQGVAAGCVLLALGSAVDFQRLAGRLAYIPLLTSFVLSAALILFGSGPGSSDAKVNLGPFQPVDAVKLLLTFFFAAYFARNWRQLRGLSQPLRWLGLRWDLPRREYFLPVIWCLGVALAFFFLQKDMGPALVIACTFLSLHAVARNRGVLPVMAVLLLAAGFAGGYVADTPRVVAERVRMFLAPWDNSARGGIQVASGLWAMASGGFWGTGPGLGSPQLVPEAHTDLILATAGEETGWLGLMAIFAGYALLFSRAWRICARAPSAYVFFLGAGVAAGMVLEVLLICGGILGLFPLSGVVSPFLSFGRSAQLAAFGAIAILLSCSVRERGAAAAPFLPGLGRVAIVMGAVFAVVVGRTLWVQVLAGDAVAARGALVKQRDGERRFEYNPRLLRLARRLGRGTIYDRNGLALATDSWEELVGSRARYQQLGVRIEQAASRSDVRHYPFGAETFHLLGDARTRSNWGASNTAYVERDATLQLRGFDAGAGESDGEATLARRDYSRLVPLLRQPCCVDYTRIAGFRPEERAVRLTINMPFAMRVRAILRRHLADAGKEKGAVVVMDAGTGDLLASVSEPLPGPGDTAPDGGVLDRARFGLYPPGSTFKLVTAMAALRADPAVAEAEAECVRLGGGRVGTVVRGAEVRDDVTDKEAHGRLRMERALAVSCNGYFAWLATEKVGAQRLLDTAARLDIQVARPNSAAALNPALPYAGFGQGQVLATPFQMARSAAVVANGGMVVEGRWQAGPGNPRNAAPVRLLERDRAATLGRAMRLAVTEGTGTAALKSPLKIAGKTGTAEVAGKASHAWFAGYAPYDDGGGGRAIAFSVLVEGGRYGGMVAAPIAAEIVSAARDSGLFEGK